MSTLNRDGYVDREDFGPYIKTYSEICTCDKRTLNGLNVQTAIRPVLTCGNVNWERRNTRLYMLERRLRWVMGIKRMEKIRTTLTARTGTSEKNIEERMRL